MTTARTETPTEEKAMTTQGPTPRTDALVATHADEHNEHGRPVGYQYCDLADFARTLERELQQSRAEADALRKLLSAAQCPNCDGSGAIQVEGGIVAACCGRFSRDGSCCGDPIPEQGPPEVEQCRWCDERSAIAAAGGEDSRD